MKPIFLRAGLLAGTMVLCDPVAAQDGAAGEILTDQDSPLTQAPGTASPDITSDESGSDAPVQTTMEQPAPECELHVWPTENYHGWQSGLLSGFGALGSLADIAAHEGKVKTVKDLMRDYLGPEIQMEELHKVGIHKTLGLPEKYAVIIEEPTPFSEELKNNPQLKEKVKEMNARLKDGRCLSASTNPCYAELMTSRILYHKAMMYGSNLFVGWQYREFDGPTIKVHGIGEVKNPLEEFPAKSEDKIEVAKAELRDAYGKDFVEYVAKKVKR